MSNLITPSPRSFCFGCVDPAVAAEYGDPDTIEDAIVLSDDEKTLVALHKLCGGRLTGASYCEENGGWLLSFTYATGRSTQYGPIFHTVQAHA